MFLEFSEASQPALALQRSPRSVRLLHGAALSASACLTVAVLVGLRHLAGPLAQLSSALFGPIIRWPDFLFSGLLYFYAGMSAFTFALFMFWRRIPGPGLGRIGELPLISILIPAYNEEEGIARTIDSALRQRYSRFEIIVIDDGSRDFTARIAEKLPVTMIRSPRNAGKAAALNAGLKAASGTIVVTCDSDSILDPAALTKIAKRFKDPETHILAGQVILRHPKRWVQRFQQLEYLFSQELAKAAQRGSGSAVLVCPGPVSAFRADTLRQLGGFNGRTITEDFDLTLEFAAAGYRASYEPEALAYTDGPRTWGELRRQRLRWYTGSLHVLALHSRLMLRAEAGPLGLFWLPHLFVGSVISPVLEVVAILVAVVFSVLYGIRLGNLGLALMYVGLIEAMVWLQMAIVLSRSPTATVRLILLGLAAKPYSLFLDWIRFVSLMKVVRGRSVGW